MVKKLLQGILLTTGQGIALPCVQVITAALG